VLLGAVPVFALLALHERNVLWVIWSMIPLWTALDALNVAPAAFPARPVYAPSLAIIGVAMVNLLISLCVVFVPVAPRVAGLFP